jgi:hypothetical protein
MLFACIDIKFLELISKFADRTVRDVIKGIS